MRRTYLGLLVGTILSVSLMGFSCNPFQKAEDAVTQKIGEKVAEGMIEKATGGKVDVNAGENQVVFKDNKTGNVTAFGEDLKLPDDFPKDVPVYPGAKITSAIIDSSGEKPASLTLKSTDAPDKVISWYEKTLKDAGWAEQASFNANEIQSRTYDKDKSHIALTVSKNTEAEGGTVVVIVKTVEQTE